MYVLVRTDQGGGFVTKPGSRGSYTNKLQEARVYETREQASKDACPENERVVAVADLLR